MASKRQSLDAMAKAAQKGEHAARHIADPVRRAKAMALAAEIKARTQDLEKAVKKPPRAISRRRDRERDRGQEFDR